jgi:hypothetical protein
MWGILVWILGIGITALSVLFVVMLFKRKHVMNKSIKAVKYMLLALAPVIWVIGRVVTETDDGRDKTMVLTLLFILGAAGAAFLGDIKRDM